MRVNTAIIGALAAMGSAEAGFLSSLFRSRRPAPISGGSCGPCVGTQACNPCPPPPCTTALRTGCSTAMVLPIVQAPIMMAAPSCGSAPCAPAPQTCGTPTCPPKTHVIQEVHSRPVKVKEVVMTPVVHERTVEQKYIVNKLVQVPQQPVCMPVCPPTTPSCVPCGASQLGSIGNTY